MQKEPIWFIEVDGDRSPASIRSVGSDVAMPAWTAWKQLADQFGLLMPDREFRWQSECDHAEDLTLFKVVGLFDCTGELLGLASYREPIGDRFHKASYMSVRPDCRSDWPGRKAAHGVGTCLIAFICHQSLALGLGGQLDLGEVLEAAYPFFLNLGAETETISSENVRIMKLSASSARVLLEKYTETSNAG